MLYVCGNVKHTLSAVYAIRADIMQCSNELCMRMIGTYLQTRIIIRCPESPDLPGTLVKSVNAILGQITLFMLLTNTGFGMCWQTHNDWITRLIIP